MGFGHRVYKNYAARPLKCLKSAQDPRAKVMKGLVKEVGHIYIYIANLISTARCFQSLVWKILY